MRHPGEPLGRRCTQRTHGYGSLGMPREATAWKAVFAAALALYPGQPC